MTEITSIRYKNGFAQDRNIFVVLGLIAEVIRYHKSQSQFDKPKVIPRFLPWRVGQLLALYLYHVQEFREYLRVQVKGFGFTEYVRASDHGPWQKSRLIKVIACETQKRLGAKLTTHSHRQIAISIGRRVVGEQFAHGYAQEMAEIEEPEMDTDDALEMSAGRGGEVGANQYGVSVDVIKHLSSRAVDTFRPLSEKWYALLGLSSYGERGQKRGRGGRSDSVGLEEEREGQERQTAMMMRNNGLGGWQAAIGRLESQAHG